MSEQPVVTRTEIAASLKKAGIHAGDLVALQSSLKSLGRVQGGALQVIGAFQDVLKEDGTLLMPTHTYSLPMWNKPPYDKKNSPSVVGKITDEFRLLPDVLRSDHPTHSVAAWGRLAGLLTGSTLDHPAVGPGSPWHRLLQAGGRIVMLGARQDANTTLHLCEALAGVPYLDVTFTPGQDFETAHYFDGRGGVRQFTLRQVPGCSRGFNKAEPFLREKGVIRDVLIVNAPTQILAAADLVEAMREKLQSDPGFLLCDNPDCGICPRRRRAIA